jgi:hydroxymethylbilane synthase
MATESTANSSTLQKKSFQIGTRKSALALAQTDLIRGILEAAYPDVSFAAAPMSTLGDKNQATALHAMNAKSLWTAELETQLLSGATDLIAHSLKDMPTQLPEGCILGAACLRTEPRDVVVMSPANAAKGWKTLADLPAGSVVGTSSVRRIAQVRRLYPGLVIEDVRGNINTRLAKLDGTFEGGGGAGGGGTDKDEDKDKKDTPAFAALILAGAGLQRIGLGNRISSFLSWKENGWLHAVGQGALGVETRASDRDAEILCQALMRDNNNNNNNDKDNGEAGSGKRVWYEALAERMLLRTLEGGCSVPIGVNTHWDAASGTISMDAMVMSVDGTAEVRAQASRPQVHSPDQAEAFGLEVARILVDRGAASILQDITLNRKVIAESGGA